MTAGRLRALARQIEAAVVSMEREDADEPVERFVVLLRLTKRLSGAERDGLTAILEREE